MQNKSNQSALFTLMTVWFFWSFVAASNGILIPLFKEKFNLSQTQAQLVDFAFYAAYFVGSVLYLIFSKIIKRDILSLIGYKNGIVIGLVISAIGAFLFYPAANGQSFPLLLTGLFIVGLGFSLQQTATQPYMIALGPPETGAQRINLGGAINNIGGTIGPVIVTYAIFGSIAKNAAQNASINDVKGPYIIMGIMFLLMAAFFYFSNLPKIDNDEKVNISPLILLLPSILFLILVVVSFLTNIENGIFVVFFILLAVLVIYPIYSLASQPVTAPQASSIFQLPQAILGMLAIFVYVGVEVTIGSNLAEYLKVTEKLDSSQVSKFVSLFWGSMMIGRWTAAIGNFNPSKNAKTILTILLPFVAFGLILFTNALNNANITDLLPYALCICIMILAYFWANEKPVRMLLIFTALGGILALIGVLTTGKIALFALISGGLFCSVLWPSIFSLGTAGLGKYTNQGSALLIMMILGGAIIPVIQGKLADLIGIQNSYIIGVACFAYLFAFGIIVQIVLRRQGIDFDAQVTKSSKAGH
jgi:MFS transporter, FHS family, L-fucose permease